MLSFRFRIFRARIPGCTSCPAFRRSKTNRGKTKFSCIDLQKIKNGCFLGLLEESGNDDHHQGDAASNGMTLFLAIDGAQPKNGDFMRRPRVPTHAQVAQTQSTPLKEKTVRPRNACPAIFLPVQQHPVAGKTCSEHSPSTAPPVYPGTPGCLALLTLPLILSP